MGEESRWKQKLKGKLTDNNDFIFAQSLINIFAQRCIQTIDNKKIPFGMDISYVDDLKTYDIILTVRDCIDLSVLCVLSNKENVVGSLVTVPKKVTDFMISHSEVFKFECHEQNYIDIVITVRKNATEASAKKESVQTSKNRITNEIDSLIVAEEDKINIKKIMHRFVNMYDSQPIISWEFAEDEENDKDDKDDARYHLIANNIPRIEIAFVANIIGDLKHIRKITYNTEKFHAPWIEITCDYASSKKRHFDDDDEPVQKRRK